MSGLIVTGFVLFFAWFAALLMAVRSIVARSGMSGQEGMIRFSRFNPAKHKHRSEMRKRADKIESKRVEARYETDRRKYKSQQFKNPLEVTGAVMGPMLRMCFGRSGSLNDFSMVFRSQFVHSF